jgi:putative nucleotidyltransferase with HDIG domain
VAISLLDDVLLAGNGSELDGEIGADSALGAARALEAAIRARSPELHGSTPTVRKLAALIGTRLGLDDENQALLDVSIRVRDVGMIGLPDRVMFSTTSISPEDWGLLNRHPVVGSEMLERLPVLVDAAEIVRFHHERWDGEGYPEGRQGDAIPLLSRVIATCDAFVAMASDRPYRRGVGAEMALEQVTKARGSQFDPRVVDALLSAVNPNDNGSPSPRAGHRGRRVALTAARRDRRDLKTVIAEFDLLPAFVPAYERVLAMVAESTVTGEMIAAIETDVGLTVAVLRQAQPLARKRGCANVADAAIALGPEGVRDAIEPLPRTAFPWRVSPLGALLQRSRVHAQLVARAADRLSRQIEPLDHEDVFVPALLHDIGKLVLATADGGYFDAIDVRTSTPEERLRDEQRTLRFDHATLGALLLRRWGLPDRLAKVVGAHHDPDTKNQIAICIRLADMVAHHAQGERVDRKIMLSLAGAYGLEPKTLRDVIFDLPHPGGSRRRRAEPSPLSSRETAVLRQLAQGKLYKAIGQELGVGASTVRSHLHNIYVKLEVHDRAQAVLRATEMGWI